MQKSLIFTFEQLQSEEMLSSEDLSLLRAAREATNLSYAPYSKFYVGAAALLNDDQIILGSNQENASFGATICAERVLLSNLSVNHSTKFIKTLAVSYNNVLQTSNTPISPCGICRQSLMEHENNSKFPIRVIMAGFTGEVWIVESIKALLPLAFVLDH